MNALFVDPYGHTDVRYVEAVPRMGDKVAMFYRPFPTVSDVLFYPPKDVLVELNIGFGGIDVLIFLK